MPNDFSGLSRKELKQILDDAQEQITAIRAELDRRQQDKQHKAIDRLRLPENRTGVQWHQVKGFFQNLLEEVKRRDD
ncbi:MAG TPA: hypothetical protein H9906_04020 [Candidatus Paenalcaligenes intestinipullorum]|uniref:Uncharacterized protein n=1 Tax=Candidatus Paenalcaligenes intestinipullorum TaxID=2838718 RepID=A0A9D2U959_9BURK|nr:hypothetical protein [Candidatus Paenalcaligenes intestinipullorum]